MKKLIILGLLSCGITSLKAQTNQMFDNLFFNELSNSALKSLDTNASVVFIHSSTDLLSGNERHNVLSGQFLFKGLAYSVKAAGLNYEGIDHTDIELHVAKSYQINDDSYVSMSVNGGFYQRQLERPNGQTEIDQTIDRNLDYDNVYGGFSLGYQFKDLQVGLSSGDLFNTSHDKSASWNLQANYTKSILDSVIVLKPILNINQGYDLDKMVAMIGLDAQLNKYVTTSMGYYTNESVHLGMGMSYQGFNLNYRYRYFYSGFRNISGGQNVLELNYRF